MQLIDAIPEKWKVIVRNHPKNSETRSSEYSLYWQTESELCIMTYLANLCMINF